MGKTALSVPSCPSFLPNKAPLLSPSPVDSLERHPVGWKLRRPPTGPTYEVQGSDSEPPHYGWLLGVPLLDLAPTLHNVANRGSLVLDWQRLRAPDWHHRLTSQGIKKRGFNVINFVVSGKFFGAFESGDA